MEYTLIRSKRKTLALQVQTDGSVTVRAPLRLSRYKIDSFVQEHSGWVEKQRQKFAGLKKNVHVIAEEERSAGKRGGEKDISARAEYFARHMGVTYGRITIREQKTRWGSCSRPGI